MKNLKKLIILLNHNNIKYYIEFLDDDKLNINIHFKMNNDYVIINIYNKKYFLLTCDNEKINDRRIKLNEILNINKLNHEKFKK